MVEFQVRTTKIVTPLYRIRKETNSTTMMPKSQNLYSAKRSLTWSKIQLMIRSRLSRHQCQTNSPALQACVVVGKSYLMRRTSDRRIQSINHGDPCQNTIRMRGEFPLLCVMQKASKRPAHRHMEIEHPWLRMQQDRLLHLHRTATLESLPRRQTSHICVLLPHSTIAPLLVRPSQESLHPHRRRLRLDEPVERLMASPTLISVQFLADLVRGRGCLNIHSTSMRSWKAVSRRRERHRTPIHSRPSLYLHDSGFTTSRDWMTRGEEGRTRLDTPR